MIQYSGLAACYDRLIEPEVYDHFAERICTLLQKDGIKDGLVLELCCGTGSLAYRLTQQGYELICCDASPEMLNIAREKCAGLQVPPVLICQNAAELDLYGTVRAAVCCLDSVNYFTSLRELKKVFSRVSLFLEPGGLFLFDVKSRGMFEALGGTASIQEEEDLFCTWQYGFDKPSGYAQHQVDIFQKKDEKYLRFTEEHYQRWYSIGTLRKTLEETGLRPMGVFAGLSARRTKEEKGRLFFAARKV